MIRVRFAEFASIPDIGGEAARMMLLVDEPGTRRLFVNDMRGPLYTVSYDGRTVTQYLDINAHAVGRRACSRMGASAASRASPSIRSSASRAPPGSASSTRGPTRTNTAPTPDFVPGGGNNTHDTVLLEWTAKNPGGRHL